MYARLSVTGQATRIDGPLFFLRRVVDVGLRDAVEIIGADNHRRLGRVAALDEDFVTVEVLESTSGLGLEQTEVRFLGRPLQFDLGPGILGRVFDGAGRIIDGGPPLACARSTAIDGLPISPAMRIPPRDFIETGVTAIDLLTSLVRGQKLPIFSAGGLPHDRLAVQIAQHARLPQDDAGAFAIVFAAIGVPGDSAEFFRASMERTGALERTALFLNLASDSSSQRLLTPRFALSAAEHLAFTEGKHVLVIMTDMTNYCEALREVSSSHGEVPGRKGYPGYMYSDLASLYERAGRIQGLPGSLTQLPMLTMPSDDIGHPVPDLTGYITEGQVVLDRDLDRRGIYPPVRVLPSLSRLMKDGTGAGFTHADHPALASQLYVSYAKAAQARILASVVGETGLSELDRRYLRFGDGFERKLIHQSRGRTLFQSMTIGWDLLRDLPAAELHRLSDQQIASYVTETAS